MSTSAERQTAFRQRQAAKGIIPVTVWAPAGRAGAIREAAERMLENGDLTIDVLRNERTGKLAGKRRAAP